MTDSKKETNTQPKEKSAAPKAARPMGANSQIDLKKMGLKGDAATRHEDEATPMRDTPKQQMTKSEETRGTAKTADSKDTARTPK